MNQRVAQLTVFFAVGLVAACSFEDPCEFGTCVTDAQTVDAGELNSGNSGNSGDSGDGDPNSGNVAPNNGDPNADNVDPNNSDTHDAATNSSSPDAGTDTGSPTSTSPVCEVDLFDFQCTPDQYEVNDSFPEHLATVGCTTTGRLRTLDMVVDAYVCPLERSDLFSVNMSSCDDQPVTLQIELELENSCSDALWELVLPRCENSDVTCQTSADGLSVTIEQETAAVGVDSPQFGLRTFDDIFLDYRLHLTSPAP